MQFDTTSIKNYDSRLRRNQQHWCKTCVIAKGIAEPFGKKDKEIAPKPLSFEDKFVELMTDVGFQMEE